MSEKLVFELDDVNCYYGEFRAVRNVDLTVARREITAMIGPSGCGKSTLLRSLNRMNDLIPSARIEGQVRYYGENIYDHDIDPVEVRRRIGMVFQKPNPFPKSIFDNVAYGPRLLGTKYRDDFDALVDDMATRAGMPPEAQDELRIGAGRLFDRNKLFDISGRSRLADLIDRSLDGAALPEPERNRFKDAALALFSSRRLNRGVRKGDLEDVVEEALRAAALWDEVKDRLNAPGLGLSGGQQQRLCIARAIAVRPEVLLMDEPCSALDPIATARIEDLMQEIKDDYTIVIVTHNMQQAARVSDRTAFFTTEVNEESDHRTGVLVEVDATERIFSTPTDERTENYITGRFG